MFKIVNYIERIENSNFSIKEQQYQEYLANKLVGIVSKLEEKKQELKLLENLLQKSEKLQNISNQHSVGVGNYLPSSYIPGVPPRRSRLDITRDKNRKDQIVKLKVEILKLESILRGKNVSSTK